MVRAKTAETVKFSYLGKDYALQLKIEDVSGCSVLVSVDPQVSGGLTLSHVVWSAWSHPCAPCALGG